MLKRITLLARRADRSFEEFSIYWRDHHAGIVKRMPMIQGYVQNVIAVRLLQSPERKDPFHFDGIVELWFADEQAQAAAFASDAAKLLPVDEPNFIRGITIFAVDEERFGESTSPVKTMLVLRSGADSGHALAALRAQIAGLPHARLVAINSLKNVAWRDHLWHEPTPPDAIVELGFQGVADVETCMASPEMSALCATVPMAGGAIGAYIVDPRRMI